VIDQTQNITLTKKKIIILRTVKLFIGYIYDDAIVHKRVGPSEKILAIDFDSVLADTMITWLEEYNKRSRHL